MSNIPIDYECTGWPDTWFGISITDCCVAHDLGGTDLELAQCVADLHWGFTALGVIMFLGVTVARPVYSAILKIRKK